MLSLSDCQSDAIRLMRERNIRRIPLVEGDRLAGMVTLDDLPLEEAAPPHQLSPLAIAAASGSIWLASRAG